MSKTALRMFDFRRDFCASGGDADRCGGVRWVQPIRPMAQRPLSDARRAGRVVVHTAWGEATNMGFERLYVRDAISTFDRALREACEEMVETEGAYGQAA